MRAERRCGELLAVTVKNTGARGIGPIAVERCDRNAPTLADMGLTKDESSRYQQLAAMPADHFETAVATAKATAGEVTTAFMLREARRTWNGAKKQHVRHPTNYAPRMRGQLAVLAWGNGMGNDKFWKIRKPSISKACRR